MPGREGGVGAGRDGVNEEMLLYAIADECTAGIGCFQVKAMMVSPPNSRSIDVLASTRRVVNPWMVRFCATAKGALWLGVVGVAVAVAVLVLVQRDARVLSQVCETETTRSKRSCPPRVLLRDKVRRS